MMTLGMGTQLSSAFFILFLAYASAFRNDFTPNSEEINRLFFYSPSAPVTGAVNRYAPAVAQHVDVILNYVDFVEKQLLSALTRTRAKRDESNRICSIADRTLNSSMYRSFALQGIPDPDRACITEIEAERDALSRDAPYSLDELYNTINDHGILLNQNIRKITSRFIDVRGNFTRPETPHAFLYNRDNVQCVLHTACGIRQRDKWRLGITVHNRPMFESLPDFARQRITEYTRSIRGRLGDPLRMRLQEFRSDEGPRGIRSGTTSIYSGSGTADPNCFVSEPIWQNKAVVDALRKVDSDLYLAENALKPSKIAILVFPLGFTLVPISLLADVSRISVLLYILLTDVLPTIPLLMRGIELLSSSQNPNREFTVRITAALDGSLSETASAEIWAAECLPPNRIRNAGIAFVTLALLFMLGGIMAEIVSRKYAKEHKMRMLEAIYYGNSGGNGRMLGVWAEKDQPEALQGKG